MFVGSLSILSLFVLDLGVCTRLNVSVDHAGDAYFIKPVFHGQEFITLNKHKPFIVTKGTGAAVFDAHYGPYRVRQRISDALLQRALGNESSLGNRLIIGSMDISAHLVSRTITQERPLLQVLFHATVGQSALHPNSSSVWCMKIYVKNYGQELTGACVLGALDNVCNAEINLPLSWWEDKTHGINVYYAVFQTNAQRRCPNAQRNEDNGFEQFNSIPGLGVRRSVSPITLSHGQLTYQEHKEMNILIYIPQRSFHPGSKFRVPIKLDEGSDLESFEIRVKVKQGLQVVGAEARNPQRWQIASDYLQNERRGAITARLTSRSVYPSNRIEEVFDWLFEVEDTSRTMYNDEAGRVVFTVSYKRNQGVSDVALYPNDVVQRKVVGKVLIQNDNIHAIVPVIKTDELVNTAILTGRPQNHAMHIYAITHTGDILDVTSQTTCYSGDHSVLKVAQACDYVYLDGTETQGAAQVNMIAKFGRHTKFMFFKVWVPELPLEIDLSDEKLSQIKGWRVPAYDNSAATPSGRATRETVSDGDDNSVDDNDVCPFRFQQSIIEVYARFYVLESDRKSFLANRKAFFSVTDLVMDSLRVADQSVAIVRGNIVEGIQVGRTEVQVMSQVKSPSSRPIAAKEVRVGNDKVTLDFLMVDVVTGMHVRIDEEQEMPGTLVAKIISQNSFVRPQQRGILDVSIRFSDSTVMPLHFVPERDYFLDMVSRNNSVVRFAAKYSTDTPQIVAVGQGKGEFLKLSMELGDTCRRKKSRVLTIDNVYVDVDFTKEELQGDAAHNGDWSVNHENGRGHSDYADQAGNNDKKDKDKFLSDTGAQQQPIDGQDEMTALEIGMYVLLGIFCIAIAMFVINCVIFVMRYKQKQVPPHKRGSVSNANDWVWIGSETLQRNAIQTDCSQALMSDQDFTVNKTVAKFLLPQSNPSSNRSSACTPGNGGSNRNSIVSTYKGSECSIRITPNPLPGAVESNTVPRQRHAPLTRPPMHTFHGPPRTPHRCSAGYKSGSHLPLNDLQGALSDIPSASALSASSSDDPSTFSSLPSYSSRSRVPTPSQQARLAQVAQEMAQHGPLVEQQALLAQAAAQIAEREEDAANGNITDTSADWDYEAMGMTYDELMEYFDNLKESTA